MNGYIVARGSEAGIHTPVNAAIVEVMQGIDSGEITPDASNVERVLGMAGLVNNDTRLQNSPGLRRQFNRPTHCHVMSSAEE